MKIKRFAMAAVVMGTIAGCADPSVWSAVGPGHEGGVLVSRMLIDVQSMPEPQRQWSEQALVEEVAKLGVTPVPTGPTGVADKGATTSTGTSKDDIVWDGEAAPLSAASPSIQNTNSPMGDSVLTMTLVSERILTVDVPITYHPGETRVTTYEHKGKTVTEIKERPGYTTGGYSYEVPVAKANFALTKKLPGPDGRTQIRTIWTALTEVEGRQRTGWAALSVDMARRAMKRLSQDNVLIVPERAPIQAAQR